MPTNGFPWDAYHVNSIDLTGNGTFLVSMRNTWAAYLVDIDTGKIEWTLGGRRLELQVRPGRRLPVAARRARLQDPARRSRMFDDHCCQLTGGGTYVPATGPSRGLVLKLDQQTQTATLAASVHRRRRSSNREYMGDTQPLAERQRRSSAGARSPTSPSTAPRASCCSKANFPGPDLSYRAMRRAVGRPAAHRPRGRRPARRAATTTVYASWNGATEVASWRVLAGASDAGSSAGSGSSSGRGLGRADDRRRERREVRVRDGDLGAVGLSELRGTGTRRGRPGDRSIPPVHAVGSMADAGQFEAIAQRRGETGEKNWSIGVGMRRTTGAIFLALTMAIALCACGGTSSASSGALTPTADVSATLERGHGLAAARHPRRLPGDPDQLPRRGRYEGLGRARRRLAQRQPRRQPARVLDRDGRELPAAAPLRRQAST